MRHDGEPAALPDAGPEAAANCDRPFAHAGEPVPRRQIGVRGRTSVIVDPHEQLLGAAVHAEVYSAHAGVSTTLVSASWTILYAEKSTTAGRSSMSSGTSTLTS